MNQVQLTPFFTRGMYFAPSVGGQTKGLCGPPGEPIKLLDPMAAYLGRSSRNALADFGISLSHFTTELQHGEPGSQVPVSQRDILKKSYKNLICTG